MFVLCLCSYFYDIIYLKYLRLIRAPAYSAKEPFKFFFGGFARVRLSSATVHVTSNFLNLSVDNDRHYIFQFGEDVDADFGVIIPETGFWDARGSFKYPYTYPYICEIG